MKETAIEERIAKVKIRFQAGHSHVYHSPADCYTGISSFCVKLNPDESESWSLRDIDRVEVTTKLTCGMIEITTTETITGTELKRAGYWQPVRSLTPNQLAAAVAEIQG